MAARERLAPPHDCRLTVRCLREDFGFRLPLERDFASLRSDNSFIDVFFERRMNDELGGEGGERIRQIRSRPAFALHYGRLRGATWFDTGQPPQGIVWLLGAQMHDERHKGTADAYDIFERLESESELFPVAIDYERLELDRRRWDTESFADDVRRDAAALLAEVLDAGRSAGQLAGVSSRLILEETADTETLYVAISLARIRGARSGLEFPLTDERFALLVEAVRQAAEAILGPEILTAESYTFPGGLQNERACILLFARRQDVAASA